LPIEASLSSLDEGNGIEVTLKPHEAKWHKSCFNKCSTLKLQRTQKRKLKDSSVEGSESPRPVKTLKSLRIPSKEVAKESQQTCLFFHETEDNLHRAATLTLESKVRAAATEEWVVCPSNLKKSLFTTANVDNIGHNPSSRTAKDSFHGTAVSLTLHPSTDREGITRGRVVISPDSPKKKP